MIEFWRYSLSHGVFELSWIAKSCPTRCDPVDCSTPGFPFLYCLPECSNSCPLSQWCCLTTTFSAAPFSCPQSFPASGCFPVKRLFTSGGPSIEASASVHPVNTQDWSGWMDWLDWLDLLAVQGTLKSLLQHHNSKASVLQCSAFFMV